MSRPHARRLPGKSSGAAAAGARPPSPGSNITEGPRPSGTCRPPHRHRDRRPGGDGHRRIGGGSISAVAVAYLITNFDSLPEIA